MINKQRETIQRVLDGSTCQVESKEGVWCQDWLQLNLHQIHRAPGWLSWLSIHLGSSHDLKVHEFQPCVGLCATSSEPGACFRFCVSFSLSPSPTHARARSLSFSLSQK